MSQPRDFLSHVRRQIHAIPDDFMDDGAPPPNGLEGAGKRRQQHLLHDLRHN